MLPSGTDAVYNVLAGKMADGSTALNIRVWFTTNSDACAAAAALAQKLLDRLQDVLTPEHVTPLVAKLLTHLRRIGTQSVQSIAMVQSELIAEAVRERPDLLSTNAGITAILRAHSRREAARALQFRFSHCFDEEPPTRRVLWQRGHCKLAEAIDPRHLQDDSMALGHCVGTLHDRQALAAQDLSPEEHEARFCLHYWLKIVAGEKRIFTFTFEDVPVATIDYDSTLKGILQIEGRGGALTGRERFFGDLCASLHSLRSRLDVRFAFGLPWPRHPQLMLNKNGRFVTRAPSDLLDVLTGTIPISKRHSTKQIEAALASSWARLILTRLPQARLDAICLARCWLLSTRKHVRMARLVSGHLEAPYARHLELPSHESGEIHAALVHQLSLPRHTTGDIFANSAKTIDLPLHRCGRVYANAALTVWLSSHERGEGDAASARHVIVPRAAMGLVRAPRTALFEEPHDTDPPRRSSGGEQSNRAFHTLLAQRSAFMSMDETIDRDREIRDWMAMLEQIWQGDRSQMPSPDDIYWYVSQFPSGTHFEVVKEALEHQPWYRREEQE